MNPLPESDANVAIAAIRESWRDAVKASDTEEIAEMVTDDVVVVHGNGRCVRGKDALKADFQKGFEAYSIEQNVSDIEVIVRGAWAFEISAVETKLTPRSGGETTHFQS